MNQSILIKTQKYIHILWFVLNSNKTCNNISVSKKECKIFWSPLEVFKRGQKLLQMRFGCSKCFIIVICTKNRSQKCFATKSFIICQLEVASSTELASYTILPPLCILYSNSCDLLKILKQLLFKFENKMASANWTWLQKIPAQKLCCFVF